MDTSLDTYWSEYYKQDKDFQLISSQEIDSFLHHLSPQAPKNCLDIGCGTGQLSRELYHRGFTVTGIDTSTEAIERARSLTVVSKDKLAYRQHNIEDTEPNELTTHYGLVTCELVYAFIKDKLAFASKVATLTAPNGIFVVVTPLTQDLPQEKQTIGVNEDDLRLLEESFDTIALYKNKGLTYFIGRPKRNSV